MICDRDGAPLIDVPEIDRTESLAIQQPASFVVDLDDDSDSVAVFMSRPPARSGDSGQRRAPSPRLSPQEETRAATPHALTPSQQLYSSQASWGGNGTSTPEPRPADVPEMLLGKILGSYRLVEVIGRGGMGTVYRAEHVKLGRDVALKLLRADYAQRRDAVARFFQEARAVNRIRHRNIVDVTDFVELDGGTTFIIMELLQGDSLSKLMRTPGALDAPRALGILIQICDGLAAAHDVKIVHRDLKPDNVIVTNTSDNADLVKLLDFGVAKLLQAQDEEIGLKTAAGSVIGTPAFMSPEQAGGLSVDARSDVYSLGAIMYEMFTGQPVFRAKSFGEYVRRHLNDTPIPPSQTPRGGHVHPHLEQIIMRCLEKSPEKRFQSARTLKFELQAVLGALETLLEGERTEISPAAPPPNTMVSLAEDELAPLTEPPTNLRPHTPIPRRRTGPGDEDVGLITGPTTNSTLSHSLPVAQSHDSTSAELGVYGGTPQPLAHGTPMPPQPSVGSSPFPVPHPQLTPGRFGLDTELVSGHGEMTPRPRHIRRGGWRVPLLLGGFAVFLGAGGAALFYGMRGQPSSEAIASTETAPPAEAASDPSPQVKPIEETAEASPPTEPARAASADQAGGAVQASDAETRTPDQDDPIVKPITADALIVVRFTSTPPAEVFPYGETRPVCTTPCDHTIDPADGGSSTRRDFVLRREGFQDSVVPVNLRDPPKAVDTVLKKTAEAETRRPAEPRRPAVREREREREPAPRQPTPRVEERRTDPKPAAEPKPRVEPEDDPPDPEPEPKPPVKTKKKKNKEVSPEDTLNPFAPKR